MSFASVRAYLKTMGLSERVTEFSVSTATVELAAAAVGVIPARIAKTICLTNGDGCILIVAAGDARVNSSKFKARFGVKAAMVPFEQVEDLTGHPPGGVCPFAVRAGVPVYLDESLRRFETVFPACGSANSAVELRLDELSAAAGALGWVDVTKVGDGEAR